MPPAARQSGCERHLHTDGSVHEDETLGPPLDASDGSGSFLVFLGQILPAPRYIARADARSNGFGSFSATTSTSVPVFPLQCHQPIVPSNELGEHRIRYHRSQKYLIF